MGNNIINEVVWIDSSINSQENSDNLKKVKNKFPNVSIIALNSLDECFNYLYSKKFCFIYLIISGKLFQDYIKKYYQNLKDLTCIPITSVYTSTNFKLILEQKKPNNNNLLNKNLFLFVNHKFYNPGGVFDNYNHLIEFIQDFDNKLYFKIDNKILKKNSFFKLYDYSNFFSFGKITCVEELIFPLYYYKFLNDFFDSKYLNDFFKFITKTYCDNKNIIKLIKPLENLNEIPNIISIKYLLHLYTMDSNFYKDLNYSFLSDNYNDYVPMNILLNKSIKKGLLHKNISEDLYRFCSLNKKEILKLNQIMINKNLNLPEGYLYSKTFLSFSKNYQLAFNFLKIQNLTDDIIPVLIQIKRNYIIEDDSSILNIDLKNISYYENEEEVLFLPYSFFTIENIEEVGFDLGDKKLNGNIITLDYCIKYKTKIVNLIKDELLEELIKKIKNNEYFRDANKNNKINLKETDENLRFIINDIRKFNKNNSDFIKTIDYIGKNKNLNINNVNQNYNNNYNYCCDNNNNNNYNNKNNKNFNNNFNNNNFNNNFNNNNFNNNNFNNNFNNFNNINNNNNFQNNINNNQNENKEIIEIKDNFFFKEYENYFPQTGLRNVGLTCYMNSILQCLLHIPQLNGFFINKYSEEKNRLQKKK